MFQLLFLAFAAPAQLRETPRGTFATEPKRAKALRTEALTLPFFDDFSLSTNGLPDPALWQSGGGTVVNNTLAVGQPSLNVVTFDGLKRSGSPYDFVTPLSQGSADSLTSQPIDLSALSARDSVYLSFFWEAKGLGELPDREDSLQVDFRTADGTWQPVWWQRGGTAASNRFVQVLLPLRTAAYFHAGFQFRFRAFGRESGAFDTWHVDYVYLNRGRRASDRFYKDLAVRSQPSSYLRRYRAMPLAQFLVKPAAETADSLKTDIGNLFNTNNFTTLSLTVR
ncbi:MAG: T9SS C-terminal target domain-containing protein, partial [Sphingobacteriaceae bacterium]|nr:T9SS C-terminal target domain-containing protein [Cytophagaceae bacterium]